MLISIGRCVCCSHMARLSSGTCGECRVRYGERIALLLARARTDRDFAEACASRMSEPAQVAFRQALGLLGVGSPRAVLRKTGRPLPKVRELRS